MAIKNASNTTGGVKISGGSIQATGEDLSLIHIFVESRGHKLLFLAASDQRVIGTMNRKLSEMESLLGRYGFLRVHQSYMVNMRYIVNIVSYRLEMQQKITLHIPKNRYQYVKREYACYKGEGL